MSRDDQPFAYNSSAARDPLGSLEEHAEPVQDELLLGGI
jgi:hypothetical protein